MRGTGDDIERYHKGTLSAAERHALEKKALSDPFLADALEGSTHVRGDEFVQDVARLNAKVQKRQTIFTPLRIAAGVLIIIAAGWGALYVADQTNSEQLMSAKYQEGAKAGVKDSTSANQATSGDTTSPGRDQLLSLKQDQEEEKPVAKNERRPRSSGATAGPSLATAAEPITAVPEEAEVAEESTAVTADIVSDELAFSRDSITATKQPLQAQSLAQRSDAKEERQKVSADDKRADFILSESAKMKKAPQGRPAPTVVTGQVTLADDGLALPGVNVRVKDSSTGTVTDINGYYSVAVNDPNAVLTFSFIGLQTQEASQGDASKLDVKLVEDVSQLSEVVVTGKATPVDLSGEPVIILAEPVGGLKAYDKYLEGNLQYPQQALDNNVKGRVAIQFTVAIDGSLGEFRVMRSLGYGCDEEVIRLVKEGPAWIPSTENNVPTESLVRVRLKFDPSKRK